MPYSVAFGFPTVSATSKTVFDQEDVLDILMQADDCGH
jgi:hypothetical protein